MNNTTGFSDFSSFARRLTLLGTLHVETALRIGTGQADDLTGADIAVIKDAQRRPFIPGSSFKGALRAHVERLARGLWPSNDPRKAACDPLTEGSRCITNDAIKDLRDAADDPAQLAKAIWENSCRVCRVFGSPWLASKVLFKDVTLKQPKFWFERSYQIRTGVGIERDSDAAQEGVLYSSETVPPGTEFKWEIVLENAHPYEEEPIVFMGLREMEKGQVPLGGSRSRGLGRVTLVVEQATVVDQSKLKDYLITGEPQVEKWDTLVESIPALVRALAAGKTVAEVSHA